MRLFLIFALLSTSVFSQSALVSSGKTISNNGSVSYSIGQVFVNQTANTAGSFNLGVQQPFEILRLNLEEFDASINYKAYPNPTFGFFNIQLSNNFSFPYQLKMYDLRGKLVINRTVKKNNATIDITSQFQGIYLLQLLKTGKQVYSFKILKK